MATWPTLLVENVLSGEGCTVTVGQGLYDRDECLKEKGSTWYMDEDSFSDGSWSATLGNRYIYVPRYVRSGNEICLTLLLKHAAGTAHFRLYDVTGSNAGTDASSTSATYEAKTSEITVPDDTWAGTYREFGYQVYVSGGTGYVTGENICLNFCFSD